MFDHSHVMYVSTDGSSELHLEHQKKTTTPKCPLKKKKEKKGPEGQIFC